jgi:hypothetical protein
MQLLLVVMGSSPPPPFLPLSYEHVEPPCIPVWLLLQLHSDLPMHHWSMTCASLSLLPGYKHLQEFCCADSCTPTSAHH